MIYRIDLNKCNQYFTNVSSIYPLITTSVLRCAYNDISISCVIAEMEKKININNHKIMPLYYVSWSFFLKYGSKSLNLFLFYILLEMFFRFAYMWMVHVRLVGYVLRFLSLFYLIFHTMLLYFYLSLYHSVCPWCHVNESISRELNWVGWDSCHIIIHNLYTLYYIYE